MSSVVSLVSRYPGCRLGTSEPTRSRSPGIIGPNGSKVPVTPAAVLLAVGLAVRPASIVGAAVTIAICALYLIRLSAPGRRDPSGVTAFLLFGALAVALLLMQVLR